MNSKKLSDLIPQSFFDALLTEASAIQRKTNVDTHLFHFVKQLPGSISSLGQLSGGFDFYFENIESSYGFAAFGSLLTIDAEALLQPDLFSHPVHKRCAISSSFPNIESEIPLWVLLFGFPEVRKSTVWNEFPKEECSIPEFLIVRSGEAYYGVVNCFLPISDSDSLQEKISGFLFSQTPAADPSGKLRIARIPSDDEKAVWNRQTEAMLGAINEGILQKGVLSRSVTFDISGTVSLQKLFQNISGANRSGFLYGIQKNRSVYFGVTPEMLFRLKDGLISTEALAGTGYRGNTDAEDNASAEALFLSQKDREEHELVHCFIKEQLQDETEWIESEPEPSIKKLKTLFHLHTPIHGKLKQGVSLIEIIRKLFPTPAVCGLPQAAALSIINSIEAHDRGLYAGIYGYLSAKNTAAMIVLIRGALLRNNKLTAFAGCGIVRESDAEKEFYETEQKLATITALLSP